MVLQKNIGYKSKNRKLSTCTFCRDTNVCLCAKKEFKCSQVAFLKIYKYMIKMLKNIF